MSTVQTTVTWRSHLRRAAHLGATVLFGALGLVDRAFARFKPPHPAAVRKILAIRLDLLGDVVFTLPALAALRETYPEAEITLLVLPYTREVAAACPDVDRVLAWDANRYRRLAGWRHWRETVALVRALRRERFDVAVCFHGHLASLVAFASGARRRVGYRGHSYPFLLTEPVEGRRYHRHQHEVEYCLDLTRALGARPREPWARLRVPVDSGEVDALLARHGVAPDRPLVAFQVGASNGSAKRWPPSYWATLADQVTTSTGAQVLFIGSASDRPLVDAIRERTRAPNVSLAGATSIAQLMGVLQRCRAVVSGDTGPLHLAVALGVPAIGLYGPTSPVQTGPFSPAARVLRHPLPCSPCYDLRRPAECRLPDRSVACMWGLSPADVYLALRQLLHPEGEAEAARLPAQRVTFDSAPLAAPDAAPSGASERPPATAPPRRVLVVKLADLGDLLTVTPLLRALRQRYPEAVISALVTPHTAALLAGNDAVDEIISFEKGRFDALGPLVGRDALDALRDLWRLGRALRRRRFDVLVLCHHLFTRWGALKYAALSLAAGAPVRVGLDNGRGWFLTHRVPDQGFGARHEADYWLDLGATLDAVHPSPRLEVHLTPAERDWARRWWDAAELDDEPVAAIHPGSGRFSVARRWPAERFVRVVDALAERGWRVVVVMGPDEVDLARNVAERARRPTSLLSVPSPRHLVAVLERCRVAITNDSGVMHLAVAAGTPTVAIFGPSNAMAWGPYGGRATVVAAGLPCSPCLYHDQALGRREGCAGRWCLHAVTPEMVLQAVERLAGSAAEPRKHAPQPLDTAPPHGVFKDMDGR